MRFALLAFFIFSSAFAAPTMGKSNYSAKKEFKKIIRKQHRDFEKCGADEVKRTKKRVKGIVLVKYTVSGDGMVTDSGIVHNTTKSRAIADCVLRAFGALKFPASFGPPITLTYPFKYNLKK